MNEGFRFESPWFLLLLLAAALVLWGRPARGGVGFGPFDLAMYALRPSRGPWLWRLLLALAVGLAVVALARPQWGRSVREQEAKGRDLMLVLDLSGSMQIKDMGEDRTRKQEADRLAAVISAAKEFVSGRAGDRIGLVFFAENAHTSCPLTHDHETVRRFLDDMEKRERKIWEMGRGGGLLGDRTAIGLGIGTAAKRLDDPQAKGRAIILITDGEETVNKIDPRTAAGVVKELGIRLYGIGVGGKSDTAVVQGMFGPQRVRVPKPDMPLLRTLASTTGGVAIQAGDQAELRKVFDLISQLEPTNHSFRTVDRYSDRFFWPLALAALLLGLGLWCEPRLRGEP